MPVPPACAEPSEPVTLDSVADAETLLVGTWIRCAGTARMFWAHEGDDVGFEFTDDGRFFRVYQAGVGGLFRAEGRVQERLMSLTEAGTHAWQERHGKDVASVGFAGCAGSAAGWRLGLACRARALSS